jgi:hypothetical protein
MVFSLFFNHLSLPASNEDKAYTLLFETFQGVLHLNINQDEDELFIYFDGNNFDNCTLAENFTYADFKTKLDHENELDLLDFIQDIEDKSPFIEYISDERLDELAELTAYFKDRPMGICNMDIFNLAWLENGIMLSLATEKLWQDYTISFFLSREGKHEPANCQVYNISKENHADLILEALKENIYDFCPNVRFDDYFVNWYNECKKEDKNKIKNMLKHCCNNNFQLGRPVIDTLNDPEFSQMKEIRVGNAHAQSGKIRLFFAMDSNRKANILIGFIKHSNDYSDYIKIADSLFKSLSGNSIDE